MSKDFLSFSTVGTNGQGKSGTERIYYVSEHEYFEPSRPSCLKRLSNWIICTLENTFYKLGLTVAHHPVITIIITLTVCGVCGIGMKNFHETKDDAKLWVPASSRILAEKQWKEETFPEETRFTSMIVTAGNILTPWMINAMLDIYLESQDFPLPDDITFQTMCVKVGPHCHVSSLLELWSYNVTRIRQLSLRDILQTVNTPVQYSPVSGMEFSLEKMISGIQRNIHGKIIGADAASMLWVLHKKIEWEQAALEWERQMVELANRPSTVLRATYIYATRTFDDEGYGAVNADISLLTAGFILVFAFVILVLGKFNLIEHKLYISLVGILCIGLAILFSYGIAMFIGFIYGPIHALMPFLLLGIGVDDMFVIVGALGNLTEEERKLPLEQRMALALKHAGVSITVTSITDIVAFGIGGSTVIPALSAFCAYAAVGILGLYGLVSTFFVACLTLDQRRVEQSRDAFLFCYVHKNYVPNKFSQMNIIQSFVEKVYAPTLMKLTCKISVVVVAVALTCVNIWSFTLMKQDFDLYNYIPSDSYATQFVKAQKEHFSDKGYRTAVYCDEMNYYHNRYLFEDMLTTINNDPYVQNGSVNCWLTAFHNYLLQSQNSFIQSQLDQDGYPRSRQQFDHLLLHFLQQREGRSFAQFIKLDNDNPPRVKASYIPLVHTRQTSSRGDIRAMESLQTILDNAKFPDGKCFCYGDKYLNNETNKVLQEELYRNLALAAACVFVVTLLLIANLWTSILVFTCVAFTVIDVTGTLQFWNVTIDTASSILIILSVGLAVDYSAHIGHSFMTISGDREERAKATLSQIGPAVFQGGFSTFLAFVLLADSKSYGFALFFRVFVTVVIFGLFHGLVYLPVILSWVGPAPYDTAEPVRKPREITLEEQNGEQKTTLLMEENKGKTSLQMNGFIKVWDSRCMKEMKLYQQEDCEKDTVRNVQKSPNDASAGSQSKSLQAGNKSSLQTENLAAPGHPAPDEPVWVLSDKDTVKMVPNGNIKLAGVASPYSIQAMSSSTGVQKNAVSDDLKNDHESNSESADRHFEHTSSVEHAVVHAENDTGRSVSKMSAEFNSWNDKNVNAVKETVNPLPPPVSMETVMVHAERPTLTNVTNGGLELSTFTDPGYIQVFSENPPSAEPECIQVLFKQPIHVESICINAGTCRPEYIENMRQTVL